METVRHRRRGTVGGAPGEGTVGRVGVRYLEERTPADAIFLLVQRKEGGGSARDVGHQASHSALSLSSVMTAGAGQMLAVVLAVLAGAMAIGTLAFKGGKWAQSVDRRLESHSSLLEAMRHELEAMRHDMSRLFRRSGHLPL